MSLNYFEHLIKTVSNHSTVDKLSQSKTVFVLFCLIFPNLDPSDVSVK